MIATYLNLRSGGMTRRRSLKHALEWAAICNRIARARRRAQR